LIIQVMDELARGEFN